MGRPPAPNIAPSWNVCPTDPMLAAMRSEHGKRIPQQMRWGLVPFWAKDINRLFVDQRPRRNRTTAPAFRDAWKKGQRCLDGTAYLAAPVHNGRAIMPTMPTERARRWTLTGRVKDRADG